MRSAILTQGEALFRRTELYESITTNKDFSRLKDALDESTAILEGIQFKLIGINKRIEELLCGSES
ncbi:hypothetical protein ACFLVM_02695, partial [Chloroflexota bacterium]